MNTRTLRLAWIGRPQAPAAAGWIERLAAWAERRPPRHHRLGRWTLALR